MRQNYTSAATSINKTRLPAVYGKVSIPAGNIVLDYGCGRYTDRIKAAIPGSEYLPYDPYNQPQNVNAATVKRLDAAVMNRQPVTVICSNVLNVIDGDEEVRSICRNISDIVRRTDGRAYITVYEGDRTESGRQTGPDQYQRNEKLASYLRFIPYDVHAHTNRNMIIIEPMK